MRKRRILPEMWPRTSWPLSSLTRNIVLGRASVISPSISIFSSFPMRRGAYRTSPTSRSTAQRAGEGDRIVAGRDLTRVLGRLDLPQELAELGTLPHAQIARQLITAHERLRRSVAMP